MHGQWHCGISFSQNKLTQICYKLQHRGWNVGAQQKQQVCTTLSDIFLHSFLLHLCVYQKSLNDERGGNCLIVPERSYGHEYRHRQRQYLPSSTVDKRYELEILKQLILPSSYVKIQTFTWRHDRSFQNSS